MLASFLMSLLDTMLSHTKARAKWPYHAAMLCKQIGGHFKVELTACELYGLNMDWVSFIIYCEFRISARVLFL